MTVALAAETQLLWWITLVLGLVVALVVVVLLQLLFAAVKRIERNVIVLWDTATTVARNTATSWLLGNTATALDELKAEALRHDSLLSSISTDAPARQKTDAGTHQKADAGTHQKTDAGTHQKADAGTHQKTDAGTHQDEDESLVQRMEQAAQRAKEESGQKTDAGKSWKAVS